MHKLYHSGFFRRIQPSAIPTWSLPGLLTLALISTLLFLTSPAHGAQSHGCAPDTPPPVTGTPITAPSTPGSVVINEILSQPHSTWNCSEPSGVYSVAKDSWIELYNTQNQALNLYAAHAELSLDDGKTWYLFPFGAAIDANGFLVVFPEEHVTAPDLPWTIVLAIGSAVIDQASVPALEADQSYARVPDGSSNWQLVGKPSIDASNTSSGQPVTPTPTKTPKPTPTPKPTRISTSGTTGSGGATTPGSSGTQPAWSGVQFPPGSTPVPTADVSSTSPLTQSQSPLAQNTAQEGWLIAVTVTCSLLLLGAALWGWRLFRAP